MKTLINKFLQATGYQIQRFELPANSKPESSTPGVLNFGPYKIETDCKPLLDVYANAPDANQFLGRLAALVGDLNAEAGIIDVGANCGDTAAMIRTHTKLPILCIEGDKKLYSLLEKNSRQLTNVTLINAYVGEISGPVAVRVEKEGWNNTLVPSESAGSLIDIVRLDELSHPWFDERRVGLLKVDAEGFDVRIIYGAEKMLKKSKPIIAFEYNRENMDAISESGMRIFSFLQTFGYEGLMTYDNYGKFFLTTNVQNTELLSELHRFIKNPKRGIYYFDMVVFPNTGEELFRKFRSSEIAFIEGSKS